MTEKEAYYRLVSRYMKNKATGEEVEVFFNLLEEGKLDTAIAELMEEQAGEIQSIAAPVVPLFKRTWFRVAAAAVVILMAGGTYFLLKPSGKQPPIAKNQQKNIDIAPGTNKAVLTLGDGSTIILDSAANGKLASQGNTIVIKKDGQLAYNTSGTPTEFLYNTIVTPRGGQYQLTLSDGSRVWLNAASSLRYPATFTVTDRKVELTGEGYFEIAKNSSMPFRVNVAGKSEVEVLGTHFNINSYADEATVKTTLLEGIVKVSATGSGLTTKDSKLLSPGQQAQQNSTGQIAVKKNNDIDEVMAWKNGKFIFQDADIQSIMRQIERWYDVEVSFSGNITKEQFVGLIPRNVNISQILKMLEQTGTVKFEVEGKKVVVK